MTVEQANELYYALDDLLHGPGTSNEIPGCDCGCGGDSIDWDQVDINRAEAEEVLNKWGLEIDD